MMTRILTIFCLAFCTMLRAASLPVSFNTTTHKIAAPLDLWTVNSAEIYNGLGLAGMSLQSPSSVSITGGSITGISGLAYTANPLSQFAATTSAQLAGIISDETGSGALVFGTSPTLTTPTLGVATATSINGTTIPSSKTLVVTTDKLSVHAATTSSELAGVISDETGTGALVLGTNPTLTTQTIIGTASTDGPTLGSEFLGASGWTSTDWTGSWAGGWTHTTGNTTALTQSTAAVSATKYQITYTVTGRTAGTFDISFGGVSTTGLSATGAWGPTTTSTASLSITPTSTFDGTIVISIKAITGPSSAVIDLKASNGTVMDGLRVTGASYVGNTLRGQYAGRYITTGVNNSAFGFSTLAALTTANSAAGFGAYSLAADTTGSNNSGFGFASLNNITSGANNSAFGHSAGRYITDGVTGNTTGSSSVFLGYDTRPQADGDGNEIVIGANAIGAGSNTATLGNTSITKTVLRGAVNIGTGPAVLNSTTSDRLDLRSSTSAQSFRVYNTYTDSSNGEWGTFDWGTTGNVLNIGTAKNGTGTARGLQIQTDGTTRLTISAAGTTAFQQAISVPSASAFYWNGAAVMRSSVDGVIRLLNNAETDFGRVQLGGTSPSFPAIKRSGATVQTVLADDSGFAATQSLYDRFGSGTPEGAVTAPVGAVYHRTDGGAGTSFYVKESGTGNTGWVAK